jgi:hypothetical protein
MTAPTRKCWGCSREVAEPATLCDACTSVTDGSAAPLTTGSAVSKVAGLSQRDWVLVLLGAAGAGIVTLGLLASRAVASPEAAAAHTAASAPAADAPPDDASVPKWSTENRARWVGNSRKSAAFDLAAENRVQVWTRLVQPTLVVRCESNAIEVFVFTESAARIEPDSDDHTISYQFDDEASVTERWTDSVEHDGLFARSPGSFADRLIRAHTLRFGFTPHNAAPVHVLFNVSGLSELIEPVAAACGRRATAAAHPSAPTRAATQESSPRH